MLEQMRRQGASIFIYVLFGLLIASFIYGLAPATGADQGGGCAPASNVAVTVDGVQANNTAFLVAYQGAGNFLRGVTGKQRVHIALDYLIRRELLAQAAAERGLRATTELAQEAAKKGQFFLGGMRLDVRPIYFGINAPDDGLYNYKKWQGWVTSLSVSQSSYLEDQARGLQAAMMSELLMHSVQVSREEALADYLYEKNTVTYDVVAFDPTKYRPAMRLTDADIKRFLEGHTAEVEARYKADERTYKGTKPQLALRQIFIPKATPAAKPADDKAAKPADDKAAKPADDKAAKPADDKAAKPADDKAAKPADDKAAKPADDKAAKPGDKAAKPGDKVARTADKTPEGDRKGEKGDKKPAVGDPPKPYGLPIDVAKAKLEVVRTSIAAGKLTFIDAEKQLAADSSDDAPASNGDRGWQPIENPGLDDKAVNDAVKTLKPGEMTPVITTERGAYLVIATDKREGDLGFDQVKNEIATGLAREVWSKEAAKRDALDALAKAQAGTKKLDQIFERELVKPGGGLEDLLNNPNMSPEERQQLLQMLQQQKHGSLEVHEEDVPVAWHAADEPSGSASGAAAAGSATAAPAAGSAAAPAGSAPASGSAATAPAGGGVAPAGGAAPPAAGSASPGTGAGSGAGTASTPAPAPAPVVIEPSKDVLPQFGNMPKAKVNRLGPAPRQARMQGVGGSKEAIAALFDELAPGDLAKKVYEGEGGMYIVLQLINRSQPNADEFDKTANAEIARMQEARGKAAIQDWLKNRCDALTKAGKIRPSPDRTRESDDKGNPVPTTYRPCMYFTTL